MVQLIGILNVTPDSFSDGGRYQDLDSALLRAIEMAEEGASVIDVGGESSRPGCESVSTEEERNRVIPVIRLLKTKISVPVSIDTRKAAVAFEACAAGATIINDISAGSDPEMFDVAREMGSEIILMHTYLGTDIIVNSSHRTVHNDVCPHEVKEHLLARASIAEERGIPRKKILLDPGIGFGKDTDENFELIRNLREFTKLPYRIVVGASRKSFLRETGEPPGYGKRPDESQLLRTSRRLGGSIAVALWCANEGVSMIRVHDVQHTLHALKTAERLKRD